MNYEYKGFTIAHDGVYGHKHIKPVGKGSVHLSLRGSYTSSAVAQRAIDLYLSEKDNTNGQTN